MLALKKSSIDGLKVLLVLFLVFGGITGLLILVNFASSPKEEIKREAIVNCQKYVYVPEEYVHRVPDECVSEYFKVRESLKERKEIEKREAQKKFVEDMNKRQQ